MKTNQRNFGKGGFIVTTNVFTPHLDSVCTSPRVYFFILGSPLLDNIVSGFCNLVVKRSFKRIL